MALNQADRNAVRPVIVPRCTAIVASYAAGLLDAQVTANPTTQQLGWAREALRAAPSFGEQVSWFVMPSTAFVNNGSGISEQDLEYLVVTAINAHFIAAS